MLKGKSLIIDTDRFPNPEQQCLKPLTKPTHLKILHSGWHLNVMHGKILILPSVSYFCSLLSILDNVLTIIAVLDNVSR